MSHENGSLWHRLELRAKPRNFRPREYVRTYLERCAWGRERFLILTHWCLTPRLVTRLTTQGDFTPIARETKVARDINEIAGELRGAGLVIDWYVLMSRNFIGHLNLANSVAESYIRMVNSLIICPEVLVVRHEDVTGFQYSGLRYDFHDGLIAREIERRRAMYAQIQRSATDRDLHEDSILNLSAEAEEARWLIEVFGDFVDVPIVSLDRFASMNRFVNFTDRLLPILPLYPWRSDIRD